MNSHLRVGLLVIALLVISLAVPSSLMAQHVVPSTDLQKELVTATERRTQNREKVNQMFSSRDAEKALRSAGVDPGQVRTAVASLSDAELAQLAARSDKLQNDFAAGKVSNRDLLFILVGIAVLILIIVAV
jgi:hypothetical protein